MTRKDSIVLELQRQALDETISASALLRKALVVAKKLRLKDFEEWANKELSGYDPTDTPPPYRQMNGEVKAWNPYRGWVPVYFQDARTAESYSKRGCGQPIPEIEGLLPEQKKPGGFFMMAFPKDIEIGLLESISPLTQPKLHINHGEIFGIIAAMRNIVLNWTLKLEENGILGEGLTFSPQEQAKATSSTVSHVTNFYGPVGQSQVQHDSPGAVQIAAGSDVIADPLYIGQIRELTTKLKDAVETLKLGRPQADEVRSELETIEAQSRSPKPKRSIITSSLETIHRILENGAGGAAGQLIYEIGKFLSGG